MCFQGNAQATKQEFQEQQQMLICYKLEVLPTDNAEVMVSV